VSARDDVSTVAKAVVITAMLMFLVLIAAALAYTGWWVWTFVTTDLP